MTNDPKCPQCSSENTYQDDKLWVCPDCSHEWDPSETNEDSNEESQLVIKDSNGTVLSNGDTVTLIKSLKVKGSPTDLKAGTKVKSIRLIEEVNGHNISCKVDGIGAMYLKSEFVKKA